MLPLPGPLATPRAEPRASLLRVEIGPAALTGRPSVGAPLGSFSDLFSIPTRSVPLVASAETALLRAVARRRPGGSFRRVFSPAEQAGGRTRAWRERFSPPVVVSLASPSRNDRLHASRLQTGTIRHVDSLTVGHAPGLLPQVRGSLRLWQQFYPTRGASRDFPEA